MNTLKKKLTAMLLTMAAFMTALPVNVLAAEQVVDPAENDSFELRQVLRLQMMTLRNWD